MSREQTTSVEGFRFCTSCGFRMKSAMRFCPQCGAIVGSPIEEPPNRFTQPAQTSMASTEHHHVLVEVSTVRETTRTTTGKDFKAHITKKLKVIHPEAPCPFCGEMSPSERLTLHLDPREEVGETGKTTTEVELKEVPCCELCCKSITFHFRTLGILFMVAFILAWTLLSLSSFGEGGSVLDRFLGKLLLSLAITVGLFALINLAYPLKRFDSEELTQWVKDHLVEEQEVSDESRTTTNPG